MNLYLHFPFCRSKCAYCALLSRPGVAAAERNAYVRTLAHRIEELPPGPLDTVYLGGGTPSLCDLSPVLAAIRPRLATDAEVTVEVNPADASPRLFDELLSGGANRLSFGFQSLDDATLRAMRRPHNAATAIGAFRLARECGFANIGFDLIAGYPGVGDDTWRATLAAALELAPAHASCYTLIPEPGTPVGDAPETIPPDETALRQMDLAIDAFARAGLERYEISNFARPGRECRHNQAVWRGEDYLGLGEGAYGRLGLDRTLDGAVYETLAPEADRLEREIFALRTRDGLDASARPEWIDTLETHVRAGLLAKAAPVRYRLTRRGAEVCDAILASL